jgi:hypothetical protein
MGGITMGKRFCWNWDFDKRRRDASCVERERISSHFKSQIISI